MNDTTTEPTTTRRPKVRPCGGGCGRITRPRNTPAPPGPPTVARVTADECYPCYSRNNPDVAAKRAREANARQLEKEVRMESAHNAHHAFIEARRRRLAGTARRTGPLVNA